MAAFFTCVVICAANVQEVRAQMSSLNTFSPYTMYGIGDMKVGGSAFNRSMGGVGVAFRNPHTFNYLNPAAMSAIPRQSALFNFAGEGQNIYSRTAAASTTYNTFNIHDLGLAVPLGKGIGLGFSMTPVTSVGYTSRIIDKNQSVVENVGSTVYDYAGDGGITQIAMSLGVNVFGGLALGVSMNYLFGNIERQYNATVTPYVSSGAYRGVLSTNVMNLSKINFTFGAQYTFQVGKGNALTLGATYQPKMTASVRRKVMTLSLSNSATDTVYFKEGRENMVLPAKLAAGIFYQSMRFSAGFDYSRQDWSGAFDIPSDQGVTLGAQQDFKAGFSYTPNRYDIRSALKRWTYKAGVRYGTSYLLKNGERLHDAAVSVGVDFPLKRGSFSKVGIGAEYGQRGNTHAGQVRERYFNIFVALSLFGDDYWFVRPKYN